MRTERRNLTQQRSLTHRFFRNEQNELILAETPNLPLIIAMSGAFLQLFTTGKLSDLFGLVFFGAIFTWCWLEMTAGSTQFRKVLGAAVLIAILWFRISVG